MSYWNLFWLLPIIYIALMSTLFGMACIMDAIVQPTFSSNQIHEDGTMAEHYFLWLAFPVLWVLASW